MSNAGIDQNSRQTLTAISNVDGTTIIPLYCDPVSHRLLIDTAGSSNLIIGTSTITGGTTGQLLYDNGGVVGELTTATYPSLTELSYVKGVTSGIQSQLNGKQASGSYATGTGSANGTNTGDNAANTTYTIGSQTQAYSAVLTTWAGITPGTGVGTALAINVGTTGAFTTDTSTNTLTNKRVTKRVLTSNAPGATPTTNTDNVDIQTFTGLATAITSMTTNLSGTPVDGDKLEFRFLDNGTAQGITWGASFVSSGTVTLPATTVISTLLRVGFEYQTTNSVNKWVCIATC